MISNCKHCSIRGPCTILLCSFRLTFTLEGSAIRIAFYLIQGLWGSIAKMPFWGRSPSESMYFSGWLTVFSSLDAQLSQLQRLVLSFTFKTYGFYSRWDGKEYSQPSRSFVAQSISCIPRLARHISLTDTRAPDTDDQQEAQTWSTLCINMDYFIPRVRQRSPDRLPKLRQSPTRLPDFTG